MSEVDDHPYLEPAPLKKTFCDICSAVIDGPTAGNRTTLPDDTIIDVCKGCMNKLKDAVQKVRDTAAIGTHSR